MLNIYECCSTSIFKQYDSLLVYERKVFDDLDIEDIHEMRVCVRKIRSALRVFRPCLPEDKYNYINKDIKKLARSLGAVRDLDVAITFFLSYEKLTANNKGVSFLIDYCRKRRLIRHEEMISFLKSKKHMKLKENLIVLAKFLSAKKEDERNEAVYSAYYERLNLVIDNVFAFEEITDLISSEIELHDLRIAIKNLRYNLEFYNLTVPESVRILKILKSYQYILGMINDYSIMVERITEIARKNRLKRPEKEGIKLFLKHLEDLKRREKIKLVLPWDVLSSETIKNLYLSDSV
ncbi:MAG: CHAD domain-containing protein [Vampirovibrionia bacterium]